MFCTKCGKQVDEGQKFCVHCGSAMEQEQNPVKSKTHNLPAQKDKVSEPQNKSKKTKMPKRKKKMLAWVLGSVGFVVVALAAFLVLWALEIIYFPSMPEYSVDNNQIEAGVAYSIDGRLKIQDERERSWDISVLEDGIDASKLGTYTVIYLIESEKEEYEIPIEFKVVEGDLPTITQTQSEFEFGEPIEIEECFKLANLKDFRYEIDDSLCDITKIGTHQIYVRLWNSREFDETYEYQIQIMDTTKPLISCPSCVGIMQGEEIDLFDSVSATDNYDGDITSRISIEGEVDNNTPGEYIVVYSVTDSSNNIDMSQLVVNVYPVIELGEKFELNNWTITVTKFYFDNRIDDRGKRSKYFYFYYDAKEGYTFLVLNLKIYNNDSESDCIADEMKPAQEKLSIIYNDDVTYKQEGFELANDLSDSDTNMVKPGASRTGKLYFVVSKTIKSDDGSLVLVIESVSGADKGKVFYLILR